MSSSTPLYMIIGALASLFSSLKIVQTRRRLQQGRNVPVSLTEALIHSIFDAVDTFNVQANQIAMIMDERMNQSNSIPMLQVQYNQQQHQPKMLTTINTPNNNNKLPSLTFTSDIPSSSKNNNQIPLLINQKPISNSNSFGSDSSSTMKLSDPMLASIPNNSFK